VAEKDDVADNVETAVAVEDELEEALGVPVGEYVEELLVLVVRVGDPEDVSEPDEVEEALSEKLDDDELLNVGDVELDDVIVGVRVSVLELEPERELLWVAEPLKEADAVGLVLIEDEGELVDEPDDEAVGVDTAVAVDDELNDALGVPEAERDADLLAVPL